MAIQRGRRRFICLSKLTENKYNPPFSIDLEEFEKCCDGCGKCVAACPEGLLVMSPRSQTPVVDFAKASCSFCGDCARACENGALSLELAKPWGMRAAIKPSCLAHQKVTCRICAEFCDERAIRFHFSSDGSQVPEIDGSACTGCGACFSACPNTSIKMHDVKLREEAL